MNTGDMFLKWVIIQNGYKFDDIVSRGIAKKYCRKMWNEYSEKIIKKALDDVACKSIKQFEALCKEKQKRKEPIALWIPPK